MRWPWAQRLLADRQGAAVQRLGLGVPALGVVDGRQVVEAAGRVGVVRAQHLLVDRVATRLVQNYALSPWVFDTSFPQTP